MKKVTMSFAIMAMLAVTAGCGGNETTEITTSTNDSTTSGSMMSSNDGDMAADKDFVLNAASGGMMEVELGKLASANGSSAQVKEFGQMMVADHSKANEELKAVAAQKNISVPTTPTEEHQKHIDDLKSKKGAEFDKAYVELMVDDHKEDIEKFEDEANKGNDADVKAFASKTLPVLQKHYEHIKKINDGIKK